MAMEQRERVKLAPFGVEHRCHYRHPYLSNRALCGAYTNYYDYLETRSRSQVVTCVKCKRKAEKEDSAA